MNHRHFKINKPYGYLSQFVSNTGKKDRLLGEFHDFPEGIMSIGRLDKTSEGLLLLTTDGKVSFAINKGKVEIKAVRITLTFMLQPVHDLDLVA